MPDFSDMRPFEPDELPAAYEELLADPTFRRVAAGVFPDIPFDAIARTMRGCRTNMEFQAAFCQPFLRGLVTRCATGLTGDFSAVSPTPGHENYTYISNHRDIVLDSGLLDLLFYEGGLSTVEIAIGDNLLIYPWIKTLVRINRSFIVTRSGGIHDILNASRRLSAYMRHTIAEKQTPIWIAQREGRSKDSMDETQESLLKMFVMTGEGSPRERLKGLNLTPLAISYEYDPCDYLKAQEFQLRRDNPAWRKTQADDLLSMRTGIFGRKGHIHYQAAPCINAFLDTLPDDMPKPDFFAAVARHIDHAIWRGYRLYPANFVALDLLAEEARDSGPSESPTPVITSSPDPVITLSRYNVITTSRNNASRAEFLSYLDAQLAKVTLPDPDIPFLRRKMLEMYANPAIHQLSLTAQ